MARGPSGRRFVPCPQRSDSGCSPNYLALSEYDNALPDIRRAVQLDPVRSPSTRAALATHLLQLASQRKDRAASLVDLRTAQELAPDYAEAHNNLAWLLLTGPQEPGAAEEAHRHARQAIDLTADQPFLVEAVRRESNLPVCHLWGVSPQTVSLGRKALGVGPVTPGTSRLLSD
jgi:tetratricopeptide (TPR) repeat protein